VADTLTGQFGFPSSQVIVLKNEQATRNNILAAFHDRLADDRTGKNDRVFVFFAGHGATRQLASGRDLGYIIPVDSDPKEFATDAIAMTDIQNIAESMQAKHVMFVMDACYSGLGLTRGGPSSSSFLRENARRSARQMLTAGGADQQVADAGPNGHSVFTWVLLQALAGKGDLNGDGLITGTELAAYVAPAVSAVSHQTPAFGSLPGSQGGEFVFQVPDSQEFLNADTRQLTADAIALNNKVDAASEAKGSQAPVTVADLQGGKAKLVVPTAGPASDRQRAQQANDRGLQLYREKQYDEAAQFTEALKLRPISPRPPTTSASSTTASSAMQKRALAGEHAEDRPVARGGPSEPGRCLLQRRRQGQGQAGLHHLPGAAAAGQRRGQARAQLEKL
jgi:uncharacterized caspase-like protein